MFKIFHLVDFLKSLTYFGVFIESNVEQCQSFLVDMYFEDNTSLTNIIEVTIAFSLKIQVKMTKQILLLMYIPILISSL